MPALNRELIRDATSLYRLIGSIHEKRDEAERTHRAATLEFLNYVRDLGECAQRYLQRLLENAEFAEVDSDLADIERQGLTSIRGFWMYLHEFVRPVDDAHTLTIPVALIEFLERTVSNLPKMDRVRIVIAHTSELNYLQYPRSGLRQHAEICRAIVPDSPEFPHKLALIAMPYSQGTNAFLNLIICHELGHFVFDELQFESRLADVIEETLKANLSKYTEMSDPDLSWSRERLKSWFEEVFCDRFAISLVGPAYSFAYIELSDVVGTSDIDDGEVCEFSDTHPSDACRFKEHLDQLGALKWSELLKDSGRTSYVGLLDKLASIPEKQYAYRSDQKPELANEVLAAFLMMKKEVIPLIDESFGDTLRPFRDNEDRKDINLVAQYLNHGVVPSTLLESGREHHPDGIALLNSAYLFYLERLPGLMSRIAGQHESNLSHRRKWSERLEMWTLKALEDLHLLSPG